MNPPAGSVAGDWLDLLACPRERAPLQAVADGLRCTRCAAVWPLRDGIVRCIDDAEPASEERRKRDEEAAIYDGLFTPVYNFVEMPALFRQLDLRPHHRVLDVGVGSGRLLRQYVRACARVVAIDFSLASLGVLRDSLPPDLRARVLLVHADATRLPLGPATFDRVLSAQLLHHLPSPAHRVRALAEMHHALVGDGVIVVEVYHWSRARAARGAPRSGRHSDDQIPYYHLDATELTAELRRFFRVERVFGLLQEVRGIHRLGVWRPVIERCIENTPLSLRWGQLLVARAVRPSATRVSIVLPTHNGARYLAEAIDSCLTQTHQDLELIVVDDGSTDATPDILRGYEARDPRVRVVRSPRRLGLPGALNAGFAVARGDFLTWTSDDNTYHPQALSTLLDALARAPHVDFVYADAWGIDAQGEICETHLCREADYLPEFYCVGACFLYRRRMMDRVGPYDESAFLAEDYDFFLRAWLAGCRMLRVPEILYRYRWHDQSLGSVHGADSVNDVAEAVRRRLLPPWRRRWLRARRRLRVALTMLGSFLRRLF